MKKKLLLIPLLLILPLFLTGCGNTANNYGDSANPQTIDYGSVSPQVKKSTTGICHEIGSTYYDRTKNFTPYDSISDCLNSGGRLPLK